MLFCVGCFHPALQTTATFTRFFFFAIWHCTVLFTFTLQKMLRTGVSKDNVPFFFFFFLQSLLRGQFLLCLVFYHRGAEFEFNIRKTDSET